MRSICLEVVDTKVKALTDDAEHVRETDERRGLTESVDRGVCAGNNT